jgi:predicted ATPase
MKAIDARHYLLDVALLRDKVDSFEQYPYSLPAVRMLDRLQLHPAVTFLIGENGAGKSTLLEAIAVAWGFNPEGGSINFGFSTRDSHSSLCDHLRLTRGTRRPRDGYFFRAESFFNVATEIEKLDTDDEPLNNPPPPVARHYGGRSLHEQSHGESFMTLFMERFGGDALYILDEPEAALSPTRQMAMLTRLHDLVKRKSQFIIATHSPILMAYPGAKIIHLSDAGMQEVKYTDTEYYTVTKEFLNRHERMLGELLGD